MPFELKIDSMDDFKEFIRIIRGHPTNDEELLKQETNQLNKSAETLKTAIEASQK